MLKYIQFLAVSFWMATISMVPHHASAYVSDEANIQVADYIISSNSNVRNYFMNMDIDTYSSCAATTIAFTAWEIRGDVTLDENSQILWALMLKGTSLARDNMIVSGYPIDTIDDMLKYNIVAGRKWAHCHARNLVKVEVSKLEYLIIHE